jgi:glutamyl-Q tRNA(Asp) synthetase
MGREGGFHAAVMGKAGLMGRQGTVVTRFAPSPTGWLHLGHVRAARAAWREAAEAGGRFLVRIEDIDPVRCRPDYAQAILEDLDWLGMTPDEPVRMQSAHMAEYRAALAGLAARGLVYPCFCSRADIAREIARSAAAPHGPDGAMVYPGTCRALPDAVRAARRAAGEPHAWRLDMAAALTGAPPLWFVDGGARIIADPAPFGDAVLGRRDAPASYHLCVVHDDAAQGVTLVNRGEDLRPATHLHVLLQHLLGAAVPRYAHHALLADGAGHRLSKRDGAMSVRGLRQAGHGPAAVLAMAGGAGPVTGPAG